MARDEGELLTTDEGVCVDSTDDSLHAGIRGPNLLQDVHMREKITRFDHERIPERVVHARGSGAHGYFQPYASLKDLTAAHFLSDPSIKTPVFARFSTVAGPRGSADTVRDVRGFAVKFYTQQGNFDLVGNNMPVFFIQDGIKFPDLIHAVKGEPHHAMPSAASAHDSFWDFVSLVPESAHMVAWLMSDRAIPRSLRMMEGFGVHTFRLINAKGEQHLVKWHWKPMLGTHALTWDEAQKLAGFDPDFHRRDLWETLESGTPAEWELGLQVMTPEQAAQLPFDILDATKVVPEELVPVRRVGKLTLDRNPDNFFAETEQVAFCASHIVPGIDFTDDPLLQVRLFSYLDTQLTRLGGPNFGDLPINRPVAPVNNSQQDGFGNHRNRKGPGNYTPNSLGGCPMAAGADHGALVHFAEQLSGKVERRRAPTFADHFSQANMFVRSQTPEECAHMTAAFTFEISKVQQLEVRKRAIALLSNIEPAMAKSVAQNLGLPPPEATAAHDGLARSPALSMRRAKAPLATRKVAILVGDGADAKKVSSMVDELGKHKVLFDIIATTLQPIGKVQPTKTFDNAPSVFYDAAYAPADLPMPEAHTFMRDAYNHGKTLAAPGSFLKRVIGGATPPGVLVTENASPPEFFEAMAQHRHWPRERI